MKLVDSVDNLKAQEINIKINNIYMSGGYKKIITISTKYYILYITEPMKTYIF
jgi:hypothetical protein